MMKEFFLVVAIILFASFLIITLLYRNFSITGYFIGFGELTNATWFNVTWHYRIKIEVFSNVTRTNWPVEIDLNFSDLIPYGTFDWNSTRLFEYDNSGKLLYEVPHQIDNEKTLIFILNGTTLANTKRIFYLYYDILENGKKEKKTYPTNLTYFLSSDNKTINVNFTSLAIYIDTNRGNNVSGIYEVIRKTDGTTLLSALSEDKPIEYIEYTNGSHTFTFDLRNNVSLIEGPVRLTLIQKGREVVEGDLNSFGDTEVIKKYYFYNMIGEGNKGGALKIEQIIINKANSSINRSSTPAGALALDINRTMTLGAIDPNTVTGNPNNPYSYIRAGTENENILVAIINLNQTNTTNFFAKNETETIGRIGIHLNETKILNSISQTSLVYFGGFTDPGTEFENIRVAASNPLNITVNNPEIRYVAINVSTNATIYNRNETILIKVNITKDILNISYYVNATIDMGTLDPNDDLTIQLFDDGLHNDNLAGDKVYANYFFLKNDSEIGEWRVNVSVYNKYWEFINSTEHKFNVTNLLNLNVRVLNKNPIEGSTNYANIEVKNFRNDSYMINSNISCDVNGTIISNFINFNNGTYQVNFTTPPIGFYVLTCNATENGNFGSNFDSFNSQAAKTNLNITTIPINISLSNITFNFGENFSFSVNVTNIGKGIAYSTNITIETPSGWNINSSFENCNDVIPDNFCFRSFFVNVPKATSPNVYKINVTLIWRNPDSTINSTSYLFNVTVLQNPLIDVLEDLISREAIDGFENFVSNFTILSIGNYKAINITFSCVSGDVCNNFTLKFEPKNISEIIEGKNVSVALNVSIPPLFEAGVYNGTVNVSAQNDKFDLFNLSIRIPPKTNFSILAEPSYSLVNGITLFNSSYLTFNVTTKNIGKSSGKLVNISLQLPSNWSSNSTFEGCGNILVNESCFKVFNITIPNSTKPGNYSINISVFWGNLDGSTGYNKTNITIEIAKNPLIDVLEDLIEANVSAGIESRVSNFTILSIGNYKAINITFSCVSGDVCNNFTLKFEPKNISEIIEGKNVSVALNVSIPPLFEAGVYNGTVNVSAQNDKFDLFNLSIRVIESRVWDIEPNECVRATFPSEGVACEIKVINLGNTYINFTIYPEFGNYTRVNVTNFTLPFGRNYTFSVLYNVTNVSEGFYNSTFTIDAVEEDSIPDNKTFLVRLVPSTPPLISFFIDPNDTFQNNSVKIVSNVTDISTSGIKYVKVNITYPNSTTKTYDVINVNGSYTLIFNDTMRVGNYSVRIFSEDNIGNFNYTDGFFIIRKFLNITLNTFSSKYVQGDSVSIYYRVLDIFSMPIKNVTVTLKIFNPNSSLLFSAFYNSSEFGTIEPLPIFYLSTDAIIGNYTLQAISKFVENNTETIVVTNYSFFVDTRTVTVAGLFADISTAVVWYPENILTVGLLVYDGSGRPTDADKINLTVYDPLGNVFFSVNKSSLNKESTGFYSYRKFIPITAPSGMYLAVANVSKGEDYTLKLYSFRISRGGPFDLKLELLETEVEQGDYLDFLVTVINFGDTNIDVFLEYEVKDLSGNVTFFKTSEFILVNSLENKTIPRRVPISYSQSPGTYLLNVKMIYDSQIPPLIVNSTFNVIARRLIPAGNVSQPIIPINITTGAITIPIPKPIPTANLTSKLIIEKFEKSIGIARGYMRAMVVSVRNIGETELSNVTLDLIGIPNSWFNITPSAYLLKPNESAIFVLMFNIPKNANITKLKATLIATSNLAADSKDIEIEIFKSLRELLEDELNKTEEEYANIFSRTKALKAEGVDVSLVEDILKEARKKIDSAWVSLRTENYEEGIKTLEEVKILLERAKDILSKLQKPVKALIIPTWLLVSIISSASAIFGSIIFIRKVKKGKIQFSIQQISLMKAIEKIKKEKDIEALKEEREKVLRSLKVLEREKATLSPKSYESIKSSLENKLKEIEKKLKS